MVRVLPEYLVNEALELGRRAHRLHEQARYSIDLTPEERLRSVYFKMATRGEIGRRQAAKAILETLPPL